MTSFRKFSLLFVVTLILSGTAMVSGEPTAPAQSGPANLSRLKPGDLATDFSVIGANGETVRLSDFRGKVVLLDFWATWCGPCIKAMPKYSQLANDRAEDGLVVLAICVADTRENYDVWVKEHASDYNFITAHDPVGKNLRDSLFSSVYGVGMLPTVFVVDREGKLVGRVITYPEERANLDEMLSKAGLNDASPIATEPESRPEPRFRGYLGKILAGDPLVDVTLEGKDGSTFQLSEFTARGTTLLRVFKAPNMDEAQIAELNYWAERYDSQGLQVLALGAYTTRQAFEDWLRSVEGKLKFEVAFDAAGPAPTADKPRDQMTDAELEASKAAMRAHFAKVAPMALAEGMMVPVPHTLLISPDHEFIGVYVGSGESVALSTQNLLLRAGIDLAAEDQPEFVYATAETAPEEKIPMLQPGKMAPDFTAYDINGNPIKVSDYRGKVVVLDFWATWCGPCMKAMPHLQTVASQYKDQNVVVLASCTSDSRKAFEAWMAENASQYPDIIWAHDPAEKGPARASRALYGVPGIPTQFVISPDGIVAEATVGYLPGEVLVDAALAKAGVEVADAILLQAEADRKNRERQQF